MANCGQVFVLFIWLTCHNIVNGNYLAPRFSRSLIFPVTAPTRIQFIGGIGIPVQDLVYESVTSGYVLKAEYYLPYQAEQLHKNYLKPQSIHRRSINETYSEQYTLRQHNNNRSSTFGANLESQQKNASPFRWTIYRSIELLIDRSGQPGRACLMRSICEHAAFPLNYEGGMLAEILHIILTPSTSHDDFIKQSNQDYLRAERLGRMGRKCEIEFSDCIKSPIDQITTILEVAC